MFKKFPYTTVILTLLAWMVFWDVKETVTGERLFFPVRWLYSQKSFAKNIEVLSYLLTDEQVAYMLAHPDETIRQPSTKELSMKNVNIVLRIRNLVGGDAWGRLLWCIHEKGWQVVDVPVIPVPGELKKYGHVIISLGIAVPERGDDSPPDPVAVKWDTLYVYR